MIIYDYTYFRKALLELKSQNFTRYQYITEKDLLIQMLNGERITDYSEINWSWISDELYGEEWQENNILFFNINGELEKFIDHIAPRAERVRVLTFLRDNCRDCLFNGFYNKDCVEAFETECARLISQNIEESKRDQFHGDFAVWPRPNLKEIALAPQPKKEYSIMESAILNAIPKVPNYREIISRDTLLQAAYDFHDHFRNLVKAYEESGRDERLKPGMSQKQHVDTINNMIIRRANRYLYGDRNPVYQVYFILGCLMGMPDHRRSWWEENFAISIGEYLEKTNNFKGSREKIQQVIHNILSFSQLQLDFDTPNIEEALAKQTAKVKGQAQQQKAQRLQKPQETSQNEQAKSVEVSNSFVQIIVKNTKKSLTKLHELIDGHRGKDIGVVLAAAAYKYHVLLRTPTEKEFRQEFPNIQKCSWRSISTWMKKPNKYENLPIEVREIELDF